jgi:DNA-binding FrmR family transcriptional regulator
MPRMPSMHTRSHKAKLLDRVRRLRGQIEGIERAIDGDDPCSVVMHRIAGARGAIAGLMMEVVEDHVSDHLVDRTRFPDALDEGAATELLQVIRTYLK